MKKTIIISLLALLGLFTAKHLEAQEYHGHLEKVVMNGKPYQDVPNVSFQLKKTAENTYKLTSSPIGPIGRMPGAITIDMTIFVDEAGNISGNNDKKAGRLSIFLGDIGIDLTEIEGNIHSQPLRFRLDTHAINYWFNRSMFNASVTFVAEP